MARKSIPAHTDPTAPPTVVTLDGVDYKLAFDFESLAQAESAFQESGQEVNLLFALPGLDLASIRVLFPCALHKFHPEIAFKEAQALVNFRSVRVILNAVAEAWQDSKPEPVKEASPLVEDAPSESL